MMFDGVVAWLNPMKLYAWTLLGGVVESVNFPGGELFDQGVGESIW